MYISRVEIDDRDHRKITNLTHLGAYHGWVENCFSSEFSQGERSRKLWRIDILGDKRYLLVVSENKPDLEKLGKYGVKGTAQTKNYDRFLDDLKTGQKMLFKITLNPCITKSAGKGHRGKTMPHITVEHQLNYLLSRAEKYGFEVADTQSISSSESAYNRDHINSRAVANTDEINSSAKNKSCTITERGYEILWKQDSKIPLRFIKATYEGALLINDLTKFRETLTKGFGKHKAYGFGLMTVMPINR